MLSPPPDFSGKSGIVPRRAPVTPRVRTATGRSALPLEFHIGGMLRAGACGVVNLFGESGSGKTTAVEHIAQAFPGEPKLVIHDLNAVKIPGNLPRDSLHVITSKQRGDWPVLAALEMAGWTDDDLIEYLAATHRQRVSSVMRRVANSPDREFFDGIPELWRIVLDVLAADDGQKEILDALHWHIGLAFPDPAMRSCAQLYSLSELTSAKHDRDTPRYSLDHFDEPARRLLLHRNTQVLLAAELLVHDLSCDWHHAYLAQKLPTPLLTFTARLDRVNSRALEKLLAMTRKAPETAQSNAASILHAMKIAWKPENGSKPCLTAAHLDGADWPDIYLPGCKAGRASFHNANLTRARLEKGWFCDADLSSACFREARLDRIEAYDANFTGCDLATASAVGANFTRCKFKKANLGGSNLSSTNFFLAELGEAQLSRANLSTAKLQLANIEGADFTGANLNQACLSRQDLRTANFAGAEFSDAILRQCNLEYMRLSHADFRKALLSDAMLTGTIFPNANFHGANLRGAGLADVIWERADLRDADFTGASFHAGSTRSGLVGSTAPCEGSKTGFYTDDFGDRDFKPPEEIRKASLRGADLRGDD